RSPLSAPESPARPSLFPYTTLFRSLTLIRTSVRNSQALGGNGISLPGNSAFGFGGTGAGGGIGAPFADVTGNSFTGTITLTDSTDRKSTRLNSSHEWSSYAVFCLTK